MSFYYGTHPLTEQYRELAARLVPGYGNADTLEGELLRAAARIGYDYHNNGMINNTSGAVRFLQKHLPDYDDKVRTALAYIYTVCNTGGHVSQSEEMDQHVNTLVESVTKYVISKDGNYVKSTYDLFDYDEPDADEYYDDEDEDEDDYDDED